MPTLGISVEEQNRPTLATVPTAVTASPKVAHVVLSLAPGGLERLVCDLSESTMKAGVQVVVCCLETEGALAASLVRAAIPVRLVRRKAGLDLGLIRRLSRWFRDEGVTIVHTHGSDPMFYGGWAAWLAGVPVRIHTQHDTMLASGDWRHRLKFRLAVPAFHDVVAVSAKTQQMLARHQRGGHLVTIPNGIDERRFAPTDSRRPSDSTAFEAKEWVIGTVARLAAVKALDRLMDAFAIVRRTCPRARLVIVGDGPERHRLESHAERLGLGTAVAFLGHQDQVEHILRQLDLFVLPSLTEGIPLALLEAMAAGLPVIATSVGGVPEVVVHGESGVLVAPDDRAALTREMLDLMRDGDKRARLGTNAVERIRRSFSLTMMSASYRALYRQDPSARWWVRPVRAVLAAMLPRALVMWRGPVDRREIALTLDDGPDPVYTPRILEILKGHQVRATFFLVGEKAARHGALVTRILADGHQIGNHSYRHPYFPDLSWKDASDEIAMTRSVLEHLQPGQRRRLFRPPYGTVCAASTLVPWLKRETVVLWNVDFKDFRAEEPTEITDRVAARRLAPGDIILYHGHSGAALEALPCILQAAGRAGLTFVPVARMCQV